MNNQHNNSQHNAVQRGWKNRDWKKWAWLFATLMLLALLFVSAVQKPSAPKVTFTTLEGKKIDMQSLKGKAVLINFWATDCPGCVKEMPQLVEMYNKYRSKGFEVIAVTMPYDPPAQVLNYATQKKLPFPIMHDSYGSINQAFGGINLVPTSLVFNRNGERIQKTIGEINFVKLETLLQKNL